MCGLLMVPAGVFFRYTPVWPQLFRLAIFLFLTGYARLLAGWGGRQRFVILFPLAFLLLLLFVPVPSGPFLLFCLGMLSWIRSGICFPEAFGKTVGLEIFFGMGGGELVASFAPHTTGAWALGVWLFFLVQPLYFILMGNGEEMGGKATGEDAFDRARMKADGILKY